MVYKKTAYYDNVIYLLDYLFKEEELKLENKFEIDFDTYLHICDEISFDYFVKMHEKEFITFDIEKMEKMLFTNIKVYQNNYKNKHYMENERRDKDKLNKNLDYRKQLILYINHKYGKINLPYNTLEKYKNYGNYNEFMHQIMYNLDFLDFILEYFYMDFENIKINNNNKIINDNAMKYILDNLDDENLLNNHEEIEKLFKIENLIDYILINHNIYLKKYYFEKKYIENNYPYVEIYNIFYKYGYKKIDYKKDYFFYQIFGKVSIYSLGEIYYNNVHSVNINLELTKLIINKFNINLKSSLCEFATCNNDLILLSHLNNLKCPWDKFVLLTACKYGYDDIFEYAYYQNAPFDKEKCLKILKTNIKNLDLETSSNKSFEIIEFLINKKIIEKEEIEEIVV